MAEYAQDWVISQTALSADPGIITTALWMLGECNGHNSKVVAGFQKAVIMTALRRGSTVLGTCFIYLFIHLEYFSLSYTIPLLNTIAHIAVAIPGKLLLLSLYIQYKYC